ncbi:MAG: HD domain-containing protein [Candidatus Aenigmatarchaeota archaeon]
MEDKDSRLDEISQLVKERFNEADVKVHGFTWFFGEHVSVVEDLALDLCDKYGADKEVVRAAALLHDVGLIGEGPEGHEERSADGCKKILADHNFSKEFREKVSDVILDNGDTLEGRVLETADALSHFKSAHFFVKAATEDTYEDFKAWAIEKIEYDLNRIHFEEESEEAQKLADLFLERLTYTDQ